MQQGGRPRFGTDISHHLLQAYLAWSRSSSQPMAVLFVDLHSAFYSVVRSSLFPDSQGDDLLVRALEYLRITPADLEDILQCVQHDNALQGLPEHGQTILRDFFHASFYQMHHVPGVPMTTRGTRPGDPLGDVLFNLVFRLVMRDARRAFLRQASLPWLGCPDPCPDLAHPGSMPSSGFAQLAFVDDLACLVHADHASQIPGLLALMTSCLHDAARSRGLRLNYTPGKTEAMISVVGAGSRALKQSLFVQGERVLPVVAENESLALRLVPTYKHLGTHIQDRAVTSKDRQHRAACARKAAGQLMRPFFSKKQVSLPCKTLVFDALVASKHLYNVHVWSWLTAKELDLWSSALRDQVRCLARPVLRGLPYYDFSCAELYSLAGLHSPMDQLHANRLRYFRRVIEGGTSLLWQLLFNTHDNESWLVALQTSFAWLRRFSTHRHLPASDDVSDWALFAQVTDRWKGIIKAALGSCRSHRSEHAIAKVHTLSARASLAAMGVQVSLLPDAGPPREAQQRITCGACSKVFSSTRALAMHCVHAHGYRRWPKYYMLGPQCLACGSMYTSRARALVHLAASSTCAVRYRSCFPPIPDALAADLDEDDRCEARALKAAGWHATKALQPVHKVPFVPLPPPGPDATRMLRAWSARYDQVGIGFSNMFGMIDEPPEAPAPLASSVPFVMNSVAGPHIGHAGVYMTDGLSLTTTRVFIKFRVFVHFFSGYRRLHDLQWTIENEIQTGDATVYCLSIDLCLQKARSDLSDEANLEWWKARMASGQLVGVGGGPSCETWSAARQLDNGPPPVRDALCPWGLPALKAKQWAQVKIGSTLVWFLLRLLLQAAGLGLCGFLEHPAYPTWTRCGDAPSVWSQPVIRWLSRLACVSITTIDQCTMGCMGRKPTTFLLLRMAKTREFMLSQGHCGRCPHKGHPPLAGLDEAGNFKTAIAKIYPPRLNLALALGVHQFTKSRCRNGSEGIPGDFAPLQSFDLVEEGTVQPDFHG